MGSLFIATYDSQGYGWGILTHLENYRNSWGTETVPLFTTTILGSN
jgi:hypothetical protein